MQNLLLPLTLAALAPVIMLGSRSALLPIARMLQTRFGYSDQLVTEVGILIPVALALVVGIFGLSLIWL